MAHFFVKNDQLLNYTISLQKINDVALPFAVQNTLNAVARDVKQRTLKASTEKFFKIKKRTFFSANSAFKAYKAKDFNYKINRLKAEVGITKGKKANESATEQVGSQQTASSIKRSVNPLGNKPQTKAIIDVLSKKPEIYQNEGTEFNASEYYRKAARAKKRNAPFLVKSKGGRRGSVGRIRKFERRKGGKQRGRLNIDIQPIASYKQSGYVRLRKKKPFLNAATEKSMTLILEKEFVKEAEKQIERAIKK